MARIRPETFIKLCSEHGPTYNFGPWKRHSAEYFALVVRQVVIRLEDRKRSLCCLLAKITW